MIKRKRIKTDIEKSVFGDISCIFRGSAISQFMSGDIIIFSIDTRISRITETYCLINAKKLFKRVRTSELLKELEEIQRCIILKK